MTSPSNWTSVSAAYLTPPEQGRPDAWADEAATKGGKGSQSLREVAEVVPGAKIAAALGLAEGELAVVRRRLIYFDDQVVELTDSYYPASLARGTPLAAAGKIKGGAVKALADLGYAPTEVAEEVSARRATDEERRLLGLGDDEWVLEMLRRTATSTRAYEVSTMTVGADGKSIAYRMTM